MAEYKGYLDFGFRLFKGMQKDNLGYVYRGGFTQNITDHIITLAEGNLEQSGETSKVKKRVFSIMVECLQNITRHQTDDVNAATPENMADSSSIFVIQNDQDRYFITTGNVVKEDAIAALSSQLDKINSFEKDELKVYHKEVLEKGSFSGKGGAGLGLIEIARKSGNKISYDFLKFDTGAWYFYLHSAISKEEQNSQPHTVDLENIKSLHQMLNDEDIILIFNGVFSQSGLMNLLGIIENQIMNDVRRKKVFNVMTEMLQNIVKHAACNMEELGTGNPGIFYISKKNGQYRLSTGNYILRREVELLRGKLEYVNSLDEEGLDRFYSMSLVDFNIDSHKEAGLGIIDLRLKSRQKLEFTFSDVNEKVSFFTLQISI